MPIPSINSMIQEKNPCIDYNLKSFSELIIKATEGSSKRKVLRIGIVFEVIISQEDLEAQGEEFESTISQLNNMGDYVITDVEVVPYEDRCSL